MLLERASSGQSRNFSFCHFLISFIFQTQSLFLALNTQKVPETEADINLLGCTGPNLGAETEPGL